MKTSKKCCFKQNLSVNGWAADTCLVDRRLLKGCTAVWSGQTHALLHSPVVGYDPKGLAESMPKHTLLAPAVPTAGARPLKTEGDSVLMNSHGSQPLSRSTSCQFILLKRTRVAVPLHRISTCSLLSSLQALPPGWAPRCSFWPPVLVRFSWLPVHTSSWGTPL